MTDIFYCLNDDCEAPLTDCGDVWHCPRCDEHFTHAALMAQYLVPDVAAEVFGLAKAVFR